MQNNYHYSFLKFVYKIIMLLCKQRRDEVELKVEYRMSSVRGPSERSSPIPFAFGDHPVRKFGNNTKDNILSPNYSYWDSLIIVKLRYQIDNIEDRRQWLNSTSRRKVSN